MAVKAKYEQALKDWETLWAIGSASDMTGAYVDSDDLIRLLRSPTKKTALECLDLQIDHWFRAGVETGDTLSLPASKAIEENPHIDDIARRHGYAHLIPEDRRLPEDE